MSTSLKNKTEKILRLLERLATENAANNVPIVVEGQKDVKALNELAVKGKIIVAKAYGKSLLEVVSEIEALNTREVILLLDFDRRGKELTRRLAYFLEKTSVKPNLFFWQGFLGLVRRDVKDIESLVSYLQTLMKKTGNS